MQLSKLGEFGLIKRLSKPLKTDSSVIKGSGDDCAVLKFDKDSYQLFTCDMLVEGVDFTRKDTPYLIGRKALAVSISDIAACGGLPRHCLVSLGIRPNICVEFIDKLFKGMRDIAGKYRINITGGDISRAAGLTIDLSMLGIVEKKYLALRSGAKKGDIIFVTGKLGGSIRGKHLKFIPRLEEARFLVKNFKVSAMIDVSDGLSQDLGQILEQSKAGAVIYEDLIPLSKDCRNLRDALYMGEDFELLFTLPPKDAKNIPSSAFSGFKPIGRILDKRYGLRLISKLNKEKFIKPKAFRHF